MVGVAARSLAPGPTVWLWWGGAGSQPVLSRLLYGVARPPARVPCRCPRACDKTPSDTLPQQDQQDVPGDISSPFRCVTRELYHLLQSFFKSRGSLEPAGFEVMLVALKSFV